MFSPLFHWHRFCIYRSGRPRPRVHWTLVCTAERQRFHLKSVRPNKPNACPKYWWWPRCRMFWPDSCWLRCIWWRPNDPRWLQAQLPMVPWISSLKLGFQRLVHSFIWFHRFDFTCFIVVAHSKHGENQNEAEEKFDAQPLHLNGRTLLMVIPRDNAFLWFILTGVNSGANVVWPNPMW